MRGASGFSLIELLIVVAFILIIAAMAIPSYLHSREEANESAAVGDLRTLNSAQVTYNSAYATVGFATTLTALGGTSCSPPSSSSACLIDTALAGGLKSGYSFMMIPGTDSPTSTYQFISSPIEPGFSGTRYFCSFADAVIRVSMTALTSCDYTVSPQQ